MHIDPNSPEFFEDFDPFEFDGEKDYVDGKSDAYVNRAHANRLKALDPEYKENHRNALNTPEWKENYKKGKETWWDSLSAEEQAVYTINRSNKIAETNITFDSLEQATEIFNKCWGEDRGELLYAKLAKEYNVAMGAIITLVRGYSKANESFKLHKYCPVDEATLHKMKDDWCKKYQPTIVVETYGSDRLAEYDELYKSKSNYNKLSPTKQHMLPSVAYHCMHNLKDNSLSSIIEYCDSIGVPKPTIPYDVRSYKELCNRWTWLKKDIQSNRHEFANYREAGDFLTAHIDNTDNIIYNSQSFHEKMKNGITWKNDCAFGGWTYTKFT